jgi:predicted dehydrogenase
MNTARKIGIGIIGLGWMGQIHAKLAASLEDCELRGVCDLDPARLEQVRKTHGVDGYMEHRALLDRRDIDAVYLVTPPTMRVPLIRDCVQAGKDILCEKPLAIRHEELGEIRALLRGSRIRFMMCFPERFAISFQEAKAIVDEGRVGRVEYVRANFRFSMKKHADLHGAWVFDRQSGGGLILESSVHLWDAIRWITGSEVVQVIGLANEVRGADSVFENCFAAIGRLANGGMACVDMSGALPKDTPTDKRFEILGTEGCVYVDEFRHFLTAVSERSIEANPGDFVTGMTHPDVMWHSSIEGGVKRLQMEFIRCLREERTPAPGVEDGTRATEITLAIMRSLSTKVFEEVPSVS